MKKKYFLSAICTLAFGLLQAQTYFADGGITYEVISSVGLTAKVAVNQSLTGSVTIPSPVSDGTSSYTVTSVKAYAFSGASITSITLPNSVTSIENDAFANCISLTSAFLGTGVTSLGNAAFFKTGLTSITIPNSVTSIGSQAFFQNASLTSVTMGNAVVSIGDNAFAQAEHATSSISSIVLPNTLLAIPNDAFANNTLLSSVTIGSSVTSIGSSAFFKTGLTSITIPNSVTSIGSQAFFENLNLTSVTLGTSVTSIGMKAFAQPNTATLSIAAINFPNSLLTIGDAAFASNVLLATVTFGNSITSIGNSTFYKTKIASITLPNSLTSIGDLAFFANTQLTTIAMGNSVASIGSQAFAWCTPLNSFTITTATPPSVISDTFNGLILSNITLTAPSGTGYSTATVWKDFKTPSITFTSYTYNGSGSLSDVNNWTPVPSAMTEAAAIFYVTANVATDFIWALDASSIVTVKDGATLTIANTFPITGQVNVLAASTLKVQADIYPTFGTIDVTSTVHLQKQPFGNFSQAVSFGNVVIDGGANGITIGSNTSGSSISGALTVNGNLTIASDSSLTINEIVYNAFYLIGANSIIDIQGTVITNRPAGLNSFSNNNLDTGGANTTTGLQMKNAENVGVNFILGTNSEINFSSGDGITQQITSRSDYKNLTISSNIGLSSAGIKNFAGPITVAKEFTINIGTPAQVTINPLTFPVTILPTGKLILTQGNFPAAGYLTLKSDATGSAVVNPVLGTITGNVTVERYIPAGHRAYRLLSSTTTGGTIKTNWQENQADGANVNVGYGTHVTGAGGASNGFDTTTSNQASVFTHNNASPAWTALANTSEILTAGNPYLVYVRGSRQASNISSTSNDATTLRTTGTLATGLQTVTGLNVTADGFSLIGNPYQAQVDMSAVLGASTDLVSGFYYVLNPANGAYSTHQFSSSLNTSGNASKYLQPGQACFVKTVSAPSATPTLSFTEANKSEALAQTAVFKTKVASNLLRISLYDATKVNAVDGLIIAFNASETNNVNDNDATKLINFNESVATSNNNNLLSIESRALPTVSDVIPLNITKYRGTSYTLKVQGYGLTETPYLVDNFTNTTTEIPVDGTLDYAYTINVANVATTDANRFKLIYAKTLSTTANSVAGFALYPNPSKSNTFNVVVPQSSSKASITVSNLLGQKIFSQTDLNSGATSITVSNVKSIGIYLVSLNLDGKIATTKWIVE